MSHFGKMKVIGKALQQRVPGPLKEAFEAMESAPLIFPLFFRKEHRLQERIRALRPSQGPDPHGVPPGPRRILFNSQFPWTFGWFEYALAAALSHRGHDILMVSCGGLPEYCELETERVSRPTCRACGEILRRRCMAFGLPLLRMSDALSPGDIAACSPAAAKEGVSGLLSLEEKGVKVGALARLNLFQYFKGYPFAIEGRTEDVFRRCLSSARLVTRAADRILEVFRPAMVIGANGKFLQWAPFVELARKRGVPHATWEDLLFEDCVIFALNAVSHEQGIDTVWETEKEKPLSPALRARLMDHVERLERGNGMFGTYYDGASLRDPTTVRQHLALRDGRPVIGLFPNVDWDSASVGIDEAFSDMYDWIFRVMDYALGRPDMDFVIRAHPAERKVPDRFLATTPVCDTLRGRYRPLPSNVRLVDPLDPITSYALAEISDVVMIYSSTLGIELALKGIRPWIAGRAYYSRKGFTLDLESPRHMEALLDSGSFDSRLSEGQRELAERFASIVRFRRVFKVPFLNRGVFSPPAFPWYLPGGNRTLDNLCAYLEGSRSMLDMDQ